MCVLLDPIWLLLPAIALYCLLATWLLDTFPLAFTLAEVMIVSQGVTLTLTDTAVQLLRKVCHTNDRTKITCFFSFSSSQYDLVAASPVLDVFRSEPVLYVEVSLGVELHYHVLRRFSSSS